TVPKITLTAAPVPVWTSLAYAKGGSAGTPILTGTGTLGPGSSGEFDLVHGRPSAVAALFFGLSQANAPFKGGVLVPAPLFSIPLATSASGTIALPFVLPAGLPPGTTLFQQIWIQDSGATFGLSASNGLKGVTP